MPLVMAFGYSFFEWLCQVWDRCGSGEIGTRCGSIKEYIELYGGQEFELHLRYSNLMMILFTTMMYGTAMPILFFIALLSFGI